MSAIYEDKVVACIVWLDTTWLTVELPDETHSKALSSETSVIS
jgi:hypothetical protein